MRTGKGEVVGERHTASETPIRTQVSPLPMPVRSIWSGVGEILDPLWRSDLLKDAKQIKKPHAAPRLNTSALHKVKAVGCIVHCACLETNLSVRDSTAIAELVYGGSTICSSLLPPPRPPVAFGWSLQFIPLNVRSYSCTVEIFQMQFQHPLSAHSGMLYTTSTGKGRTLTPLSSFQCGDSDDSTSATRWKNEQGERVIAKPWKRDKLQWPSDGCLRGRFLHFLQPTSRKVVLRAPTIS